MLKKIRIALHKGQRKVLADRTRYNALNCGRRFGKTTTRSLLIPEAVLQYNVPTAYLAPNFPTMQEVWAEDKKNLQGIITHVDNLNYILTLENGQHCRYWSAEKFDNLRGKKYGRVIWDELTHKDTVKRMAEIWQQVIRPTLLDYKGDFYGFATPKGTGNFWYDMCNWGMPDSPQKRDGWSYHHATTYDNPYISAAEIAELKADLPELVYRQEILAEFVDLAGALFRREHFDYCSPLDPNEYEQIGIGVDLAITEKAASDYTAVVVMGKTADPIEYHVIDAARIQTLSNEKIRQLVLSMARKHSPEDISRLYIGCESVGFQSVIMRDLRRQGEFNVISFKPVRDKLTRAYPLISRYESLLVKHSRQLPADYEKELLGFAPPFTAHDDYVDASVYAFTAASRKAATVITL